MPSFAEYKASRPVKRLDADTRRLLLEERRAQALLSISLDDLLESDDWGKFEKHVEVLRDQALAARDAAQNEILGEAVGDALLAAKLRYERAHGQVQAYLTVLCLPAQLKDQTDRVEAGIARLLDAHTPV